MQNKHQTFFSFFGGPTYGEGGGGGVRWLGQMPNFFRKTILKAPLSTIINLKHCVKHTFIDKIYISKEKKN